MSLNQITNPSSQLDIYARKVNVPETPDCISFHPDLLPALAAGSVIRSHYVRLGDMYTIFCRASFTAGATGTTPDLSFIVNIPGLFLSSAQEEAAPLVRHGAFPTIASGGAGAFGWIVEATTQAILPPPGAPSVVLVVKSMNTAGVTVQTLTAAAGNFYDLSFTISLLAV